MIGDVDSSAIAIAAAAIGVSSVVLLLKLNESPPQKLSFDYGKVPPASLPLRIITSLPDFIRIPLLTKTAKPSPPRDAFDILGTNSPTDPYVKKWEILPGKIWGVRYFYLIDLEFKKGMEMILGGGDDTKKKAIENAPDHMKEILANDFEVSDKYDQLSEEERAKMGGDMFQDMFVAKIEEGLIIYNPCRMHPQIIEWINGLGKVKFIVSGSSSHTNHLPGTAVAFPNAKIICASAADAKCKFAGMRPADYLYDLSRDEALKQPKLYAGRGTMEDAREALNGHAALFHVRGDVATQALFFMVHNHLFEVDLMYTMSDDGKKESEFDTGTTINHSKWRIFYYSSITEKVAPIGYTIPIHRCLFMDPTAMLSKLGCDSPEKDGSSCTEMAQSLRKILKVIREPGVCKRVHCVHALSMNVEDFCQQIDKTWGWLDGKSLIV